MAVRLFVGNLPYSATEAEIRELFSGVGPVSSVRLPVDRETGRPRGFAFVEYADRAHAEEAIRRFHNQNLGGRPISVNEARPQERGAGPPPRRDGPAGGGYGGGGGGGGYGGGGGFGGPRPGGEGRPMGPRPGPGGYGPPPGDRGPRPGGFPPGGGGFGGRPRFDDAGGEGPSEFDDPNARRRNFGPDALPKRARKKNAKGGKGDREQKPKGPLGVRGGGRIFYADDDEENELIGDEAPEEMTDHLGEGLGDADELDDADDADDYDGDDLDESDESDESDTDDRKGS